jgi:hypothetical protein
MTPPSSSRARRAFVLVGVAMALLLAVIGPSSALAQTKGPADDLDDLGQQYQQYLQELQNVSSAVVEVCQSIRSPDITSDKLAPDTACVDMAKRCARKMSEETGTACAYMVELCQKHGECGALLPPQPDGAIFQFSTDWAKWLVSYWVGGLTPMVGPRDSNQLDDALQAVGFGLLGVVLTFGLIHYWASGLVNAGGGMAAVMAPLRVAGAGLFIVVWPTLHIQVALVGQSLNELLIGSNSEHIGGALWTLNGLFHASDGFQSVVSVPDLLGRVVSFILAAATALVVLALSASKLGLTFGEVFLCAAMPVLVALWVLPGLSWLATSALKAVAAIMLVHVGWAATLAIFSPMANGFHDYAQGGAFVEGLADPLVGIVLLLFLFTVMHQILHWAGVTPSGSRAFGAAWSTTFGLGMSGMRMVSGTVRSARANALATPAQGGGVAQQRSPTGPPNRPGGGTRPGPGGPSGTGGTRPGGPGQAPVAAGAGAPVGAAPAGTGAPPSRPAPSPTPSPTVPAADPSSPGPSGAGTGPGAARPSPPSGDRLDMSAPSVDGESITREFGQSDARLAGQPAPSQPALEAARAKLAPDQQHAVRNVATNSSRPEQAMAQWAATAGGPVEQAAYRTLLDGARHPDSHATFIDVATQGGDPPTPKAQP